MSMSCMPFLLPCFTDQSNCSLTGAAPPTDVTVEQTGVSTVLVMWTAPSYVPIDWYQVEITRGSTTTTVNVAGTSYTQSSLQHGVYSIRVISLTHHFPSEATEPVEITVRGKCVVSIEGSDMFEITILHTCRLLATSYLCTLTHCHISHHHLDSA